MGLLDSIFGTPYSDFDAMPNSPNQGGLLGAGGFLSDPRNQAGLAAFGRALAQAGAPKRGPSAGWGGGLSDALAGFSQGREGFDAQQMQKQMQQLQLQQAQKSLQPKAPDPFTLSAGQVRYDGAGMPVAALQEPKKRDVRDVNGQLVEIPQTGTPTPIFGQPKLPEYLEYGPNGKPQINPLIVQAKGQIAAAGKPVTNLNVNTGQKGFDNELKLRGDFRSEPVYKAHQEMQSAFSQIGQALGQKSPAGDLAGATKIMKLLDPGSVVRESELGMAMAASGLLDRVQNYAQNIMKGTKLTPTQRADFQNLANKLYDESVKQYNAKRDEYQTIAKDYDMNADRITGKPSTASSMAGWSITPVPITPVR